MPTTKTVGEVIAALQQLDPAARVWVSDSEWGLLSFGEICKVVPRDRPFLGSTIRAAQARATATDRDVAITGVG